MAATAFTVGFCTLLFCSPFTPAVCLAYAAVLAPVAAYTELISHGGNDTVSVPVAVALFLGLLSFL